MARWKHGRRSREAREHHRLTRAVPKTIDDRDAALVVAMDKTRPDWIRDRAWEQFQELRDLPRQCFDEAIELLHLLRRRAAERGEVFDI